MGQDQGFFAKYINHISEDKDGNILLGTYGSDIYTYNGLNFEVFGSGLNGQNAISFLEHDNKYFLASDKQLIEKRSLESENIIVFESETYIKLHSNESEYFVFSSGNKLFFYTSDSSMLVGEFFGSEITEVLSLGTKRFLILTAGGDLFYFDELSDNTVKISQKVYGIIASEQDVFVIFNHSVYEFDLQEINLGKKINDSGFSKVTSWTKGKHQAWVYAENALFKVNKSGIEKIDYSPNNLSLDISSLKESWDGTLWIGTFGQGLFKLYDSQIQKLKYHNNEIGNINSLFVNPGTEELVIASNQGLFINKKGNLEKLSLPSGGYHFAVTFSDNEILVAGEGYLLLVNTTSKKNTVIQHPLFFDNDINVLLKTENKLFVGTSQGLFAFGIDLKYKYEVFSEAGKKLTNITQLEILENDVLAGIDSGRLIRIEGNMANEVDLNLKGFNVMVVKAFRKDLLWIGGNEGTAFSFDLKSNEIVEKIKSERARNVFSLIVFSKDDIILGTDRGLERHFHGKTLYYDDRIGHVESNLNTLVSIKQEQYVAFGSGEGLFLIDLDYKTKLRQPPRINKLILNGEEIHDFENGIKLPYRPQVFFFQAVLNDFVNGKDTRIDYRLVGFSQDWIGTEIMTGVQFSNLPPGEYGIELKVSHFQGDVQFYKLPLKIFVEKPIWMELWFLISGYLLFFFLVAFGYMWFQRKNIRENEKLRKLVSKRTKEIQKINIGLELTVKSRTKELNLKNQALEQSMKRMERMLAFVNQISSNSRDIFCLTDSEGKVLLISKGVEKIIGQKVKNISGQSFDSIFCTDIFNKRKSILSVPEYFKIVSNKGEEMTFEVLFKEINRNKENDDIGYVVNIRDVTERETLKEQIQSIYKNIHRDFHDEVGNKIARIIALVSVLRIQSQSIEILSATIDKIEVSAKSLFNDTRDFIWSLDKNNNNLQSLGLQLRDFGVQLFEGSKFEFQFHSNCLNEILLPPNIVRDIMLIIKELLTNVLKHSSGNKCVLLFLQKEGKIIFLVKDNGSGMKSNNKGNGLKNLFFRAERCKGELIFKTKKGTLIGVRITL
ncbi:PAS domain S-box protein [Arthrospiribacter ruber]|uniref:sensor histidine kinase n=1 Tax=Arthrospiribacter ruber TaxID=2487934 RepID=UPI001C5B4B42